jgi:hypothetical protein
MAAPPASSGVLAFEAISPALAPAVLTALFPDDFAADDFVLFAADFARDPPELVRLRARDPFGLRLFELDEPFLLELRLVELLLEDFADWAISLPLWSLPCVVRCYPGRARQNPRV